LILSNNRNINNSQTMQGALKNPMGKKLPHVHLSISQPVIQHFAIVESGMGEPLIMFGVVARPSDLPTTPVAA
jgi:hypothetical protein